MIQNDTKIVRASPFFYLFAAVSTGSQAATQGSSSTTGGRPSSLSLSVAALLLSTNCPSLLSTFYFWLGPVLRRELRRSGRLLMMFLPSISTLFSVTVLLFDGAAQVQAHVTPWARGIWECTDGKNPVRLLI